MTDPGPFVSQNLEPEYSKEDLLKLLLQFEGELEKKEEELTLLKDDKAHTMLNQAKYGKLTMIDPLAALRRDGIQMNEKLDESVLSVYEYQQRELERLFQLHKSNHTHYKEMIVNMEKRHKKIVDELRSEIHRNEAIKSQKEDIVNALEESRDSLAKDLETKNEDLGKFQQALQIEKDKRDREKNDHKLMIKYLLSERRDLFIALQKMKLELNHKNGSGTATGDSPLVQEMRKEIDTLRMERNRLAGIAQEMQRQNTDLSQRLKIKEEDLQTLRQNMAKTKQQEPINRSNIPGGLVVANRGAMGTVSQNMSVSSRSRLPNSSSFPSTAPGTSLINGPQKQQPQPSTPMYKKFPTASSAIGSLPRTRGVPYLGTKASNLPLTRSLAGQQQKSSVQAEMDQLGTIVDSMGAQQLNSTISKRSSSLPRNPPSKAEAASHHTKPPSSGIPTHPQRQPPGNQRTPPNSLSTKNSRVSTANPHSTLSFSLRENPTRAWAAATHSHSIKSISVMCPLCMEKLEIDDLNFYPCTCKYQVCRFCWHRIRTDENGLCPACRTPYPEDPVNFQPLTPHEMQQLRSEKKQKEKKRNVSESRKHLAAYRVLQRNLVYVLGLSPRIADPEILKSPIYFGKYGKVLKVAVGTLPSSQGNAPINTAYVTFSRVEDALRTILECMYLHEVAPPELSFTKEDMHAGKHTEYERRLLEKVMQQNKDASINQKLEGDNIQVDLQGDGERAVSPLLREQRNNSEDGKNGRSIHDSEHNGQARPNNTDLLSDYHVHTTANIHREHEGTSVVDEPPKSRSPAPFPVYEDDLGFDPLAESLKGLEELLQEESHTTNMASNRRHNLESQSYNRMPFNTRGSFDIYNREHEYPLNQGVAGSSQHGVFHGNHHYYNDYHQNGFGSHTRNTKEFESDRKYRENDYPEFFSGHTQRDFQSFLRREHVPSNRNPDSFNLMGSNNIGQRPTLGSLGSSTHETRDAFKALLPNVNVSFVSSSMGTSSDGIGNGMFSDPHRLEMSNMFSSNSSQFVQASNHYPRDNFREYSDPGYQQLMRQSNMGMELGRQPSGLSSNSKWMVSPPPGFDTSGRNQGQT
ncbi:hypothetical protein FO519_001773 [Halicephalobus sp. NKZ332]|nr:hypothetical protein FO519_001773 [Halicephalobus sp. NKZ332]